MTAALDIANWSPTVHFLALSSAVCSIYILHGYMQELLFRLPGMQPFGLSFTMFQCLAYSAMSLTEMKLKSGVVRRIPWRTYFKMAFYTAATKGLTNASIGYLNYPTQVIFKCCKLIPVLIGGIIIQRKRYGLVDVVAAVLMSLGLAMFLLADSRVSPNFHPRGYVMICLALIVDAVIGNVQEKAIKQHSATNTELVLYSYSLGSFYLLGVVLATNELPAALHFFTSHPGTIFGYMAALSVLGYFGINAVLGLLRMSGALITVTVTSLRKAITIILSFYFFSKPFTTTYVWAGLIVLASIYLNTYSRNKMAFKSALRLYWGWMRRMLSCLLHGGDAAKRCLISV